MDQAKTAQFQCDVCGKVYRWSEELAGKQVVCSCGETVTYPKDRALARIDYDVIDEPEVADKPKQEPPPPPAQAPVAYGGNRRMRGRPVLGYQKPPPAMDDTDLIKNIHMPLWLLVGGLVVETIVAALHGSSQFEKRMMLLYLQMIVCTGVTLFALTITAKSRGIDVGPLGVALLKLAAVSVAPTAVTDLIAPTFIWIPLLGPLLLELLRFMLFFGMLGALFDMQQSDTWFCVFVLAAINIAAYIWLPHV